MYRFSQLLAVFATFAPDGVGYGPNMTDTELAGLDPHAGKSSHAVKAASFPAKAQRSDVAASIAWELISATHPEYDAPYWQECRALYSGGKKLLRNLDLMARVFPSHTSEDGAVYAERVKRAHYFPYPGAIIDSIASGLGADPITVLPSDPDDKDAKLGDWWTEFFEDVTKKGADRCGLHRVVVDQLREAMITGGRSWMLVDMPREMDPEDPNAPQSRLDQEEMGLLNPYITTIPAEAVIEWQETDGELEWLTICDTEARRESILTPRGQITKSFTIWTRSEWTRYEITFNPAQPPQKDTPVPWVASGVHKFGKVPVVRIQLPEGLRAMDKLESMAREHLNKRNALSWAEYKSLFALLYEFLAPEEGTTTTPTSEAQQDPDRALSVKGQGYVNERGADDSAAYVGPDSAPFSEARDSCDQIKSEMYRVMHSMADSVDMGTGASRRSGESKAQDHRQKDVLLKELGRYGRDAVKELMDLLQVVKGEESHRVGGGDSFDSVDLMSKVTEAVELVNGLPMKSPTFLRVYLERIYTMVLKGELTDNEKASIRKELAMMITMEEMQMMDPLPPPPPRPDKKPDDKDPDDDDLDDDDDEERAARRGIPMKSKIDYKG